jgi:hypothetical protein
LRLLFFAQLINQGVSVSTVLAYVSCISGICPLPPAPACVNFCWLCAGVFPFQSSLSTVQVDVRSQCMSHMQFVQLRLAIVGNHPVTQCPHRAQHTTPGREVGGAHVRRLHAYNINQSLFEAGHLGCQVGTGQGAEVLRVRPSVRSDLVTGFVCILQGGLLAVDTSIERASHEKGAFCAAGGQGVYELASRQRNHRRIGVKFVTF